MITAAIILLVLSTVCAKESYYLHIWIPHAFLLVCAYLQFFFFNLLCKNRSSSLGWGWKCSHKIIWCVYIWVAKYNSYHVHLSLSHWSFILCTVVTIMTFRRKAGFLTPKWLWVFACSLSSNKWNTLNSIIVEPYDAIFSLQVKLVIIRSQWQTVLAESFRKKMLLFWDLYINS